MMFSAGYVQRLASQKCLVVFPKGGEEEKG